MQLSELDAAIMKVRDEGFDESFIDFCAKTFSSHTYPAKNQTAARMHAYYLRLALDALCSSESKTEILLRESPEKYDVSDPESLCLQLAAVCYRDASEYGNSFCELFIERWCSALGD